MIYNFETSQVTLPNDYNVRLLTSLPSNVFIFDFLSSPFVLNRGARDSHKHKIARLSEFHAEDLHLVNATKFFRFVSMSKIDHRIIKASQIVLVEIPDEDQLDLHTYVRC